MYNSEGIWEPGLHLDQKEGQEPLLVVKSLRGLKAYLL